jgi:serine/threonine-protein kinase
VTVDQLIGVGGMSEVYRATTSDGEPCAVKILMETYAHQEKIRALFDREMAIVAKLDHPNIVGTLERGFVGERQYLTVDWINGPSLRKLARARWRSQKDMPPVGACAALADVADALGYAHNLPERVLHRDVSPDNVIVSLDGRAVLIDFGIATSVDSEALTRTNEIRGKVGFMAPEYLRGDDSDGRADLFSLGVCAYWLFTRQLPFPQTSVPRVYSAMLKRDFPPLREQRPGAPAHVVNLVDALLQPDPGQRPGDGAAIAEALREVIGSVEAGRRALSHLAEPEADTQRILLERPIGPDGGDD